MAAAPPWKNPPGGGSGAGRRLVFAAVGAFSKAVTSLLNNTTVHNADSLLRLVRSRPSGLPLLTVSNHTSTLDDPLMWGFEGFPTMDADLARWVLAAEDICFKNRVLSCFFRLGKCVPIIRGGGIYQENMDEALNILAAGGWDSCIPSQKARSTKVAGPSVVSSGALPVSFTDLQSLL